MISEARESNSTLSPTAKRVLDDFVGKIAADDDVDDAAAERMHHLIFGSKPPKADDFAKALFDPAEGDSP